MRSTTIFLLSALSLLSSHCGQSVAGALPDPAPPAQFASRNEGAFWSLTDARNIALTVALLSPDAADTSLCATRSTSGAVTTLRGTACPSPTARNAGTLQFTGNPLTSPSAVIDYLDWSQTLAVQCAGSNTAVETTFITRGTVRVTARGNIRDFDVDITGDGSIANSERCTSAPATFALRYRGSVDFGSSTPQRSFRAAMHASGTGTLSFTPYGRIDTSTRDLVFDPAICAFEPASGALEMRSARRQALLRYDGSTRCGTSPSNGTAPFSLDGVSMGELPVASCSVRRGHRHARSGSLSVLLIAGGLSAQRRRSRVRASNERASA